MNAVCFPWNPLRVVAAIAVLNGALLSQPLNGQFAFGTAAGTVGQSGSVDSTNGSARFNEPAGIAIDSNGTIFVADSANHTIRRITRRGTGAGILWTVSTIAGMPGQGGSTDGTNNDARFYYPYGIAVHGSILYVADTYNHTIRQIEPLGTNWAVTTLAGTAGLHGTSDGTGSAAAFYYPYSVAVNAAGALCVADSYNHAIRLVTSGGAVSTIAGRAGADGVADGTNTDARFYFPSGISSDASGNLFVADTYNSLIRKVTQVGTDWVTTTVAGLPRFNGSADGTNRYAQFNYPFGIAAGSDGTLYIADTLNSTLRSAAPFGTNWVVNTIGGQAGIAGSSDGPSEVARFNLPYALAVDGSGNLFVADTYNNTIRFGQPGFLLQASLIAGQMVLSWPVGASNYVLETSGSLTAGALWTSLTSGITLSGDHFVITNPVAPPAFFRLRLP